MYPTRHVPGRVLWYYGAETGGGDAASPDGLRGILKTPGQLRDEAAGRGEWQRGECVGAAGGGRGGRGCAVRSMKLQYGLRGAVAMPDLFVVVSFLLTTRFCHTFQPLHVHVRVHL
jgi:hypothetical protein